MTLATEQEGRSGGEKRATHQNLKGKWKVKLSDAEEVAEGRRRSC